MLKLKLYKRTLKKVLFTYAVTFKCVWKKTAWLIWLAKSLPGGNKWKVEESSQYTAVAPEYLGLE